MRSEQVYSTWSELLEEADVKEEMVSSFVESLSSGGTTSFPAVISHEKKRKTWDYYTEGHGHTLRNRMVDVKELPLFHTYHLQERPEVVSRALQTTAEHRKILRCGGMTPQRAYSCNRYLASIILQMTLRRIMLRSCLDFLHIPQIYDIVGEDNGFRIYSDNTNAYSPSFFTVKDAHSIIRQLAASLTLLQKKGFNHGNPSREALSFHRNSFAYLCEGHQITGDVLLCYRDLSLSSATFDGTHLFTESPTLTAYQNALQISPFEEIVNKNQACQQLHYRKLCNVETLTYRLTTTSEETYDAIRHGGVALYSSSFDFYHFLLSLMCYRPFRETVLGDEELRLVWANLWMSEEDFHEVMRRIESNERNVNLNGLNLRCDITRYVLKITERS